MPRLQPSIAATVTLALTVAATLLLATLAWVGYNSHRSSQWDLFRTNHVLLADQLAISLTLPLWNFDRDVVGQVIEGAMQDHDVEGIVVQSVGNVPASFARIRDKNWRIAASEANVPPAGFLTERRSITMAGETIGDLQVFITPRFLEARLRQTLLAIAGGIALFDLILVAGLYLLLWRIVLKPLKEVERHAVAVSAGDRAGGGPLPPRYSGELESLRRSIEKMVAMLDARYADLSKSEANHRLLAESLRESEEKFSRAFRSGPNAMTIAELESGRYIEVNDGFERLFGYTRAETIGRTASELGMWRASASRDRFIDELRAGGAVRDREIETVNRHGAPIAYILSAEAMTLAGRACSVCVLHDITDRKRAEHDHARAVARERQTREEFTKRLIASQEAERRRIAGELHDSLGQNLLLIKNRAQLTRSTETLPPELHWQLESIHDMAAQGIAEVRQISHDLRPYQLDQLGLTRALEALIDGVARNTGFQFTRKLDGVDDLFAPEAATHLYRIVQESLSNILNHARARRAHLALERDVLHLRLHIEDDGRGFTPGEPGPVRTEGGLGLQNIAERVRILGGNLEIDSAPDRGTRIEIKIGLPESA